MSKLSSFKTPFALLASCCLLSVASFAQEENLGPVEWLHDGPFALRTEGNIRITEMEDNVRITRGKIEVIGDKAVLEQTVDTRELVRVTVTGSPVHYKQILDTDGEEVTGTSETLVLYEDETSKETIIELVGSALINTPDSSINCAAIVYNAAQAIIPRSTGPCGGVLTTPSN